VQSRWGLWQEGEGGQDIIEGVTFLETGGTQAASSLLGKATARGREATRQGARQGTVAASTSSAEACSQPCAPGSVRSEGRAQRA